MNFSQCKLLDTGPCITDPKPNEKSQTDMLSGGLAEILCRVAEGGEAVFCIPGPNNCFEPAAHYGIDGVTEKVIYFLH